MSLLKKIKDVVGGNADKADQVIDKAADFVDDKTGNKHTDKIDGAAEKAKDIVDGLDGKKGN